MNIKARLTLLFTLLVASILLLFCFSIYYFYDQYREQQFFSFLTERVFTVTRLMEDVDGITKAEIKRIEQANNTILIGEEITVYDENNLIIYDSGQVPLRVPTSRLRSVRQGELVRVREGMREIIMQRYQNKSGKIWVIVAYASDRIGFNKLDRLRDILGLGWLLSLIVVAGAGWFFARDAIKPVAEINSQVNNISAGNLHDRLTVGRENDELANLAQTFNLMLDRLEIAFKAQKSFVAHASHELRTPLAVMMADIEVTLMKDRETNVYRESLGSVLDEVRSLNEMVNQLLELARTEEGILLKSYSKVRLDEVLWQAQDFLQQKNPLYQVVVKYNKVPSEEKEITILGDETLLRTAFTNLMENACKYSENMRVEVHLDAYDERIFLHFVDQGVGIPAQDIPFLFNTFYRSEHSMNRKGYGIGLALTKRIIDIHKGTITIKSVLGEGSDFIVQFPQLSPIVI